MERFTSNKKCPKCDNFLEYWISDDFYCKGTKFYSCDVCKWNPNNIEEKKCINKCSGETVCSECP